MALQSSGTQPGYRPSYFQQQKQEPRGRQGRPPLLEREVGQYSKQSRRAAAEVGGLYGEAGGFQDQLLQMAAGTDPRWAAFRDQQMQQITQQQEQGRGMLENRGVTGSALMNEMGRYDQQAQQMSAQLGMSEMGRQDQLRQQGMGMLGVRSGLKEQQLGMLRQPLMAAQVQPTLDIARLAAENAGKQPGGAGGNNWWDVGNWDWEGTGQDAVDAVNPANWSF